MNGITELSQTSELMCSSDYKDRFLAEYCQLVIRLKKLTAMMEAWDASSLESEPICSREMYRVQIRAMMDYWYVLKKRAAVEGISLPED